MDQLVTIGLPVFNGETHLLAALRSLTQQTYQKLEVLVFDNASTDSTPDIAMQFARNDDRVAYRRHPFNLGAAANHNAVATAAAGSYFKWAAYDDICAPEFVEGCVTALQDPSVAGAYTRTELIDGTGASLGEYRGARVPDGGSPSHRLSQLLAAPWASSVLHFCLPVYGVFRTGDVRRSPLIGSYNGSDTTFILHMALRGALVEVDEVLFRNRKHETSSLTGRTPAEVARWFDPRMRGEPMVRTRFLQEYLRQVLSVEMPSVERARCVATIARWVATERRWRVMSGEVRRRLLARS